MALHSRYDPVREAERYVDAETPDFTPAFIVVTEPGESWLAGALRKKFPRAVLIALRYDAERFSESDSLWDAVWRPGRAMGADSWLFNRVSDETLCLTLFLRWKPADDQWPESARLVWSSIASVIKLQKDIMFTRSRFGRRWLANIARNLVCMNEAVSYPDIRRPVFLALAGPSLERQFPFERDRFFVCAASSALACLNARGVTPDLCFATDGGQWARPLFRELKKSIPVAFPLEASIPSSVFESSPSVLLDYGSRLERRLIDTCSLSSLSASRNGTVAGTAALFFLAHTSVNVYAAGLDLCSSPSFSHARPHESALLPDSQSSRIEPSSLAQFSRNRNAASLDVYASWFSSRGASFTNRFFRLAPAERVLGNIRTVDIRSVNPAQSPSFRELPAKTPLVDRETRRNAVIGVLDDCVKAHETGMKIKGAEERRDYFSGLMTGEGPVPELMQMISYTGYIGTLKKIQTAGEDPRSAIDGLCREILPFARSLAGKIGSL